MQLMESLGSLERDLAFWKEEAYGAYQPQFGVEPEEDGLLWLTDHGRRIALVHKRDYQIDFFEFTPGRPRLARPALPKIYHAPSLLGAKLTIIQWVNWNQCRTSDTWKLDVETTDSYIRLAVRETWEKWGMESLKTFELRVHPQFGYVLYTENNIHAGQKVWIEFANFLAAGMADHRPDKIRFPYVVWRHPTRGLMRWTSNHATTRMFGHLDSYDRRKIGRNGWIGLLGERDWNPVFALTTASQDCAAVTCPNLLYEHLHVKGAPTRDEGGKYVWKNSGALLALPGTIADRLVDQAQPNDLETEKAYPERVGGGWFVEAPIDPSKPRNLRLCEFSLNKLCDFETTVAHDVYFRGGYWPAQEEVENWARITTEKAHSGKRSLQLHIGPDESERSISPQGSSLWLNAGKRYRFSGWLCYEGPSPQSMARISATQIYFSINDPLEMKEARLTGDQCRDWRRFEMEFTALEGDPAVVVQIFVSGEGSFFVDDILLQEMS